tara:strand:- start:457 stop:684 length:228 start_codon:yes stop_codon:yes gene_type:complete
MKTVLLPLTDKQFIVESKEYQLLYQMKLNLDTYNTYAMAYAENSESKWREAMAESFLDSALKLRAEFNKVYENNL